MVRIFGFDISAIDVLIALIAIPVGVGFVQAGGIQTGLGLGGTLQRFLERPISTISEAFGIEGLRPPALPPTRGLFCNECADPAFRLAQPAFCQACETWGNGGPMQAPPRPGRIPTPWGAPPTRPPIREIVRIKERPPLIASLAGVRARAQAQKPSNGGVARTFAKTVFRPLR